MQDQSQAEARILSLIAEARPGWRVSWSDRLDGLVYLERGAVGRNFESAVGFVNGRSRARALLDAVERAAAKGWK